VLRVGLTGGIGSGKSTVARRLVALGAVLVDSDVLAREVVAPDTAGLAEIVTAFGTGVLAADGALDRPALAAVVFGDPDARERLNAIVHPRVRECTEALVAGAAADAIVVQDVPLLVETRSPAAFDLVVVVHAAEAVRLARLEDRGLATADARARIAAQADDDARRAAADVWLDNDGAPEALHAAVDALWHRRLVPFEVNLRAHRPVPAPAEAPVDPDPRWPVDGARIAARVARAAGGAGLGVAHIGPTAVPGLPADDVLDIQAAIDGTDDAAALDSVRDRLDSAGFPRVAGAEPHSAGEWRHGGADPGRPVRIHVRAAGSPAWRAALLWRDWLRVDAAARSEYVRLVSSDPAHRLSDERRWQHSATTRAEDWAAARGWTPSPDGLTPSRS
jgi:dephospho-CoA kinase